MIKNFIKRFFELNNQQITESKPGFKVSLDPAMQQVFQKETLNLVFDVKEVDEQSELVTYGSSVLNHTYLYLQSKGEKIVSRLPRKHKILKKALVKQLKVLNASLANAKLKNVKHVDIILNFKISYLSDEKSEELYSIGIDHNNALFDPAVYYDIESIYHDLEPLDRKSISFSASQLENQFKVCLKDVAAYAQKRAKNLQDDMLKRLHRDVSRLKSFYYGQIEEMNQTQPGYERKRITFEREYQHKLRDEVNNHRLRVILKLVSYHLVERSDIDAILDLEVNKKPTDSLTVSFDCFTGELDYGSCPTCATNMEHIVVDQALKIGCPSCTYTCSSCNKITADLHQRDTCHVCHELICPSCFATCSDCGKTCCPKHTVSCKIGREVVCADCSEECSVCKAALCADHAFHCALSGSAVCFEHKIACRKCRRVFAPEAVKSKECPECGHGL